MYSYLVFLYGDCRITIDTLLSLLPVGAGQGSDSTFVVGIVFSVEAVSDGV